MWALLPSTCHCTSTICSESQNSSFFLFFHVVFSTYFCGLFDDAQQLIVEDEHCLGLPLSSHLLVNFCLYSQHSIWLVRQTHPSQTLNLLQHGEMFGVSGGLVDCSTISHHIGQCRRQRTVIRMIGRSPTQHVLNQKLIPRKTLNRKDQKRSQRQSLDLFILITILHCLEHKEGFQNRTRNKLPTPQNTLLYLLFAKCFSCNLNAASYPRTYEMYSPKTSFK